MVNDSLRQELQRAQKRVEILKDYIALRRLGYPQEQVLRAMRTHLDAAGWTEGQLVRRAKESGVPVEGAEQ